MIDPDGYRPNVGIVLMRADGRVLWARRRRHDGWQFPQGGMRTDETPVEAMYRELEEEIGLRPEHVEVLGETRGWLRYRLPRQFLRLGQKPLCIGQKQVWFLLRLLAGEEQVRLDVTDSPEFDLWKWVDFWHGPENVVQFKRQVYLEALHQLAPIAQLMAQSARILGAGPARVRYRREARRRRPVRDAAAGERPGRDA